MDCVFIGYATNSKACHFFVHKSEHPDIYDNIVMESNSAEFFEHIYQYKIRLESCSGGSKQPREEPKENEQKKKVQDAVNVKRHLLHLDQILLYFS